MDISKLKEDVVDTSIDFGKEKVKLGIKPNVYTSEDGKLSVEQYVAKGLGYWDVFDNKKELPITAEIMKSGIPDTLLSKIFDKIIEVKQASMGKSMSPQPERLANISEA